MAPDFSSFYLFFRLILELCSGQRMKFCFMAFKSIKLYKYVFYCIKSIRLYNTVITVRAFKTIPGLHKVRWYFSAIGSRRICLKIKTDLFSSLLHDLFCVLLDELTWNICFVSSSKKGECRNMFLPPKGVVREKHKLKLIKSISISIQSMLQSKVLTN